MFVCCCLSMLSVLDQYFFLNEPTTTEIYSYCHPLPPHAALPICEHRDTQRRGRNRTPRRGPGRAVQREFAARFEQGKLGLGRRRQIVDDVADDLFERNGGRS